MNAKYVAKMLKSITLNQELSIPSALNAIEDGKKRGDVVYVMKSSDQNMKATKFAITVLTNGETHDHQRN